MIKFGNKKKREVDAKTRAQLIRKGNEFFNARNIEASERIFVIVDYKDGLIRLGDYYLENKNIYKACEMYYMSENSSVIETFLEKYHLQYIRKLNIGEDIIKVFIYDNKIDDLEERPDKIHIEKMTLEDFFISMVGKNNDLLINTIGENE